MEMNKYNDLPSTESGMSYKYHMPTKVFSGKNCIINNSELLAAYGKKAMIVTGRNSAKTNGSLDDVISALEKEDLSYVIFDKVMSNPTIAVSYEGAAFAKENDVDFIIAVGGGSPLDAAKAMALLAKQNIDPEKLFNGQYGSEVLPVIAVPTTAGTGSEVTQYAILTNDEVESKTSIATELIFPKIAFLDAAYMKELPVATTINTAVDALSHAVEGMLTVRSAVVSEALAKESLRLFVKCVPAMKEALATNTVSAVDQRIREDLAQCSMLAGMVIAQTGTTIVHGMGYSLTYFKDIDHGRANGLLLAEYLRLVEKEDPVLTTTILTAMSLKTVDEFKTLMGTLLGEKEDLSKEEILQFSDKAIKTPNINNCKVKPTQADIKRMYAASF